MSKIVDKYTKQVFPGLMKINKKNYLRKIRISCRKAFAKSPEEYLFLSALLGYSCRVTSKKRSKMRLRPCPPQGKLYTLQSTLHTAMDDHIWVSLSFHF